MDETRFDVDELLRTAEGSLKRGLDTIQALAQQPGAVTAAMAIAGLVTGALLRSGARPSPVSKTKSAEPLLVFAAGAAAGLLLGKPLLRGVFRGEKIH